MTHNFTGFSTEFFSFFKQLKQNNNREWFNDHKNDYETHVVEPILDFIAAFSPKLKSISPHFLAIPKKHGGSMFRIYKDARFSKDKRPYKTHAAVQFRHAHKNDVHAPGFYVHLEPDGIRCGGGIWLPPSDATLAIRERIRDRPDEWKKATQSKAFKLMFGGVDGEQLKNPPRGFDADLPHMDDLRRKTFFISTQLDEDDISSADFLKTVEKVFKAASPMMEFLTKAVNAPY